MRNDPAFLFYPGDASEDTQFMNRLERGCYFDLLKAQKKFGRFTLDHIKKVLGRDFETCWPAIEMVLAFEDGQYFISWVDQSIQKRKEYSESRRANRKKADTHEADKSNISASHLNISFKKEKHMNHICESQEAHMGNGIGNENEIVNTEEKGGAGEKGDPGTFLVPRMFTAWKGAFPQYMVSRENDFPALHDLAHSICDHLAKPKDFSDKAICNAILELWYPIVAHMKDHSHYCTYSLERAAKHIQSIFQSYNKPKQVEKTGLQYLYERFCEDGKVDSRLITEEHYQQLFGMNLVAIDDKTIEQVTKKRLKALESPMNSEERDLHTAYKAGDLTNPLIQADKLKIETNAMRQVVINFFKSQKAAKATELLKRK
jgi:hypothetical protein